MVHAVQQHHDGPTGYVRPTSIDDVLERLDADESARLIAGGTDLLLDIERGASGPVDTLIDLTAVEELRTVEATAERLWIGAAVTHNQAMADASVREHALSLAQACAEVGSPALRNRATLVGNVVTASPANDTISALVALDAVVHIRSSTAERQVDIGAFHLGVRRTVLERNELVTGLSLPIAPAGRRAVFAKLGLRSAQAISVVHAAVTIDMDADATVRRARIALGSVAPTIVRVAGAEDALVGEQLSDEVIDRAARAAAAAVAPIDDLRAPADYRTRQIETMLTRMIGHLRSGAAAEPLDHPLLGGPIVTVVPGATSVNGSSVDNPPPSGTALEWLRDDLHLTGTKEGCAEGECGACTVLVNGTAVLSCLTPAGALQGQSITTIEGLAQDGELHPMQRAFVDAAAVQCGFCIPGFLVAGAALAPAECADGRRRQIGLSGNVCRCTGYYAIETAVGSIGSSAP